MAQSKNTAGEVVHAWLPRPFAQQVRELADRDGRSISNLINVALRDRLSETSPSGGGEATARGGGSSPFTAPVARAGNKEE